MTISPQQHHHSNREHVGRMISFPSYAKPSAPVGSPPFVMSKMLISSKHIGNKVSISPRLRWVRLPYGQKEEEKAFMWWPGVLYKSFSELMVDLNNSLSDYKAYCLIQDIKTRSTKPQVIYLLGRSSFECKTLLGNSDFEEETEDMKPFYNYYQEMEDKCLQNPSIPQRTKDELQKCLSLVTDILEKEISIINTSSNGSNHNFSMQVIEDNRVGTNPFPHVSPEETTLMYNAKKRQHTIPTSHENVAETKNKKCERPLSTIQKAFADEVAIEDNRGKKDEKIKTINMKKSSQKIDMRLEKLLNQKTPWTSIWPVIQSDGWEWQYAGGKSLASRFYIRPGKDVNSGVLGKDYFDNHEDVIDFYRKNINTPHRANIPQNRDESLKQLLKHNASWASLWKVIQNNGWRWQYAGGNSLASQFFIRPGKDVNSGELGKDYFDNQEDVIDFYRTKFNMPQKGTKRKSRRSG